MALPAASSLSIHPRPPHWRSPPGHCPAPPAGLRRAQPGSWKRRRQRARPGVARWADPERRQPHGGGPTLHAAPLPPPLPHGCSSSSSSKRTEPQRHRNPHRAQLRRGQGEGVGATAGGVAGAGGGPPGAGGGGVAAGAARVAAAPRARGRRHLPGQGAGAARPTPRGPRRLGAGGPRSPGAAKCKQSAMISLFS